MLHAHRTAPRRDPRFRVVAEEAVKNRVLPICAVNTPQSQSSLYEPDELHGDDSERIGCL